jgi:hypothetical protein
MQSKTILKVQSTRYFYGLIHLHAQKEYAYVNYCIPTIYTFTVFSEAFCSLLVLELFHVVLFMC